MSASASPRVSVVIRAYNRQAALCELLRAVLRQRFADFEVVVVEQSTRPDGRRGAGGAARRPARARAALPAARRPAGAQRRRARGPRRGPAVHRRRRPAAGRRLDRRAPAKLRRPRLRRGHRPLGPGAPDRTPAVPRRRTITAAGSNTACSAPRDTAVARLEDELSLCYRFLRLRRPGAVHAVDHTAAVGLRVDPLVHQHRHVAEHVPARAVHVAVVGGAAVADAAGDQGPYGAGLGSAIGVMMLLHLLLRPPLPPRAA
jgi:hypothetical protein